MPGRSLSSEEVLLPGVSLRPPPLLNAHPPPAREERVFCSSGFEWSSAGFNHSSRFLVPLLPLTGGRRAGACKSIRTNEKLKISQQIHVEYASEAFIQLPGPPRRSLGPAGISLGPPGLPKRVYIYNIYTYVGAPGSRALAFCVAAYLIVSLSFSVFVCMSLLF